MSDNVTSMGIEAIFGTAVYNDMNNWDNDMFYLGKYLIEAGSVAGDINVRPGTVLVAGGAFNYDTALTSVTFADGDVRVNKDAFAGCTALTNVAFGDGNVSIDSWTFDGCT